MVFRLVGDYNSEVFKDKEFWVVFLDKGVGGGGLLLVSFSL